VSTAPFQMRRADEVDLPAIVAVQEAAYAYNRAIIGRTPIPLEWDYAEVLRTWEVWLADDGAADPAGVLILSLRPGDLYIESVAVAPRAQGSGAGNVLLTFAEDRARQEGRGTVRLLTNALLSRNNDWYARKGYTLEWLEHLDGRSISHRVRHI